MHRKIMIFLAFVSMLLVGWFLMGAWWLHDLREVKEELVVTESGDKYIFQFITAASHHAVCKIIDPSNKKEIADFIIGIPATFPVRVLIDSPQLRCYEVSDRSIIYQINNKFYGIEKDKVRYVDPKIKPELIVVAKTLTANKEWKWLKVFGDFLVKANDRETILLFERYSRGQFSSDELDLNQNSGITQVHMQEVSMMVLSQSR